MRVHVALYVCVLSVSAASCSRTAPTASASTDGTTVAEARTAIEAANARIFDALKRKDKAGVAADYADDAIELGSSAVLRSADARSKGLDALFVDGTTFVKGTTKTDDVLLAGNLAVENGTFAWTYNRPDGKTLIWNGSYLAVWRHEPNGSWKIIRNIGSGRDTEASESRQ